MSSCPTRIVTSCTPFGRSSLVDDCIAKAIRQLVENQDTLNTSKMEWVTFPTSASAYGKHLWVSANDTQLAIYVSGIGWRFSLLSDNIIP